MPLVSKSWQVLPRETDDLIEQLLINRGLKTKKEQAEFLNPSLENYSADINIPSIKNAVKRIKKAIEKGEQITVYGDYDVDGICASAILYKALSSMGAKVLPYIPHREKEGYGLSHQGLEFVRDSGSSLVITVDNGIVALEQAKFAKQIGLDLIITDHHLPLEEKPEALEIVHSLKMCGAGVAWCLIQEAVSDSLRKELLELVAIATVADLIPLLGVARAFVFEGLKVLNRTKNLGLQELLRECAAPEELTAYEIGHLIAPRINAIGRLQHAIDALRLLCTKEPAKARNLAKLLCETNIKRQLLTTQAVEEARVLISQNGQSKIHILDSKDWVPGIIGLVAARVCEEHFAPAIALSVGETQAKGSARSVGGINIVEVIRGCSDLLVDVGGHSGAAGFTILNENIPEFKKRMAKALEYLPDDVVQTIDIEAEVEAKELTKKLAQEIGKLEPFGFGNPKPLLLTKRMRVTDLRTLKEGKHLKLKAEGIDAIGFGMGEWGNILKSGQLVDLVYFLEINKFNGYENLQLRVKDLKIAT